jgi:beta-lactamase superfamily II metal-dependent hydrolase
MKNTVHMLKSITNIQMMSFVITTEDDKVIVIDGGWPQDMPYLVEYLQGLTGLEKPCVHAWILTHPHNDHIRGFIELMEGNPDALDVEKIYYNFPSAQFIAREDLDNSAAELYRILPLIAHKCCIVSGGDEMDVGAAHFEFYYSPDSEFNRNVSNNASLIFRVTLGGKTVLFTGDAGVEAGKKVLRMYGGTGKLKADYVQMAHHGQGGAERNFYEIVRPKIALYTAPMWLWECDNGKGRGSGPWKTLETRAWLDELGVQVSCPHAYGDYLLI